jgi:hypothetical protein
MFLKTIRDHALMIRFQKYDQHLYVEIGKLTVL